MDEQLKLLISLHEQEKIRLQKLIGESLMENEYLLAHYHSEALDQLMRRLWTLNNIEDKLYDDKQFQQIRIIGLQKDIKTEHSDYMLDYYEDELRIAKRELEKLNQVPKQNFQNNKNVLDETLKKLVDRKVKNVKLILKKSDNIFLAFSYIKNKLRITFPQIKQHSKNWILDDDKIVALKNLGFEFIENETKLAVMLTGHNEDILKSVHYILFKITFEIFNFKEFDNESYIKFTDIISR